jgi:uncharacterized membrane protein YedE/YeeE
MDEPLTEEKPTLIKELTEFIKDPKQYFVILIASFSGFFFALGLSLSGMTKPTKVIGFLDFFGLWDPSLGIFNFENLKLL